MVLLGTSRLKFQFILNIIDVENYTFMTTLYYFYIPSLHSIEKQ